MAVRVDARRYGLQALSMTTETCVPQGWVRGAERDHWSRLMFAGFATKEGQEQEWFVECQKAMGTGSGLTYISGFLSAAEAGDKVFLKDMLTDTGSDFNVVSGLLLERLLGRQWRQHLDPIDDHRGEPGWPLVR